ncbi:MAG: replication initiation factor domain-containing protein [Lactococcus lactis]|uniref:replication initiation factor domain-containing protein n=1 Tax=Lactococcus lactis TaxID=1358 RepID=UPI0035C981C0
MRSSANVTQQFMCDLLGISLSYYRKMEKGERAVTSDMEKKIRHSFFKKRESSTVFVGTNDYTNIRFQTLNVREVVSKILGLNIENFHLNEYNRYQYPFYISYGHINVYYHDKDMKAGVLIEMSGQACREMEYEFEYHQKQRTWYDFFNDCFFYANKKAPDNDDFVKITRFDLALDEQYNPQEGNFDLFKLLTSAREGRWNGRKQNYSAVLGGRRTKEGMINDGLTVYFGSKQTHLFFRFYEKDYERASQEMTSVEAIREMYGLRNRYEISMRKEISTNFIKRYIEEDFDLADEGVKIINDNLTFYDKEGNLDTEWYDMMGRMDAYHFTVRPEVPDLNRKYTWFERGGPVSTYLLLKKAEELTGENRLEEIFNEAELTERQEKFLKEFRMIRGANG